MTFVNDQLYAVELTEPSCCSNFTMASSTCGICLQ